MESKIMCSILIIICVFLMAGCGNEHSSTIIGGEENRFAGEYVSSSWHNDTVAHFLVKPNGDLSGYLLVMYGYAYEMIGSISPSGTLTLSIKDPTTQQPVPGTTSNGSCDGTGICTGTTYASPSETFQYVLNRVTPNTNKYYGVFKGSLTGGDITPAALCWFGIDFNGNIYGFADGLPSTHPSASLAGVVNMSTGMITLENLSLSQFNITIIGNIGTDGSINNGTWQDSTSSGVFSALKMPFL
jgi:hypothetical protein